MKVAIAGYGIEGEASCRYWQELGDEVTVLDSADKLSRSVPEGVEVVLGPTAFDRIDEFDMVVRTASLPPSRLKNARRVWSATNEFFANCPAPIIGVTGTKGKGTISSLIDVILKAAGKQTHLLGNIGIPALDKLSKIQPDDIVIYELSSFQLWDLEVSPHVAVISIIEPDHLDRHANFDDYIRAKANIRLRQTENDVCFYHPRNRYSSQLARVSNTGKIYRYNYSADGTVYESDGNFMYGGAVLCSLDELKLPGVHNIDNACAAMSVAMIYGVDGAAMARGLRSFTGLPHRLKIVREFDGVSYYDDSIATTPGSALAALRAFPDQRKIIVLGGSDKGASYDEVVAECNRQNAHVIAIGQTGRVIAELCQKIGVVVDYVGGGMDEVVAKAHVVAHDGDVVILSPASASFDQYKNYVDRGEQFIAAVQLIGK